MTTLAFPAKSSFALRILLADDNEAFARTFTWMLEALGHKVQTAHNGTDAITLARSFSPDVLILDISLPGMSGYEICQNLRADPQFEKSVFIAQTGWSQPEHQEQSRAAGFHQHWVKPITIDRLEELLTTLSAKAAA